MFNFFKKSPTEINIYAPISGEILPLSASPDEAFAQGILGDGVCINPTGDTVYAPFDCDIEIFHTLHAVGCNNGIIEAIIHVGMNTVGLQGEGFTALHDLQGKVKSQTPLISFNKETLLAQVTTLITPVIIVSKPENAKLEIVKNSGSVNAGDLIMKIIV